MVIGAFLLLPLARFLQYPDRISTLASLQVDAAAYDRIGADLAQRWTVDAIPSLQPPGFVTLLALVFSAAGHSWIAAKVMLWLVLVGVTVLTGLLARRVYESELAGWVAAWLCALSPALGWYAQTLQYELVAALFILGLITAATMKVSASVPRVLSRALVIGLAAGLAALTREVLIVVAPIVAWTVGQRVRTRLGSGAAWAATLMVIGVALSLPLAWSTVQSRQVGRTVTLSDKGPLVLAFGNNPQANGTFNAGLTGVGEPSGIAFMRAEPRQTAWLMFRKVLYFWGLLRDGWNVPRPSAVWAARATGGLIPLEYVLPWARGGWLLVVVIIGLARWRLSRWRTWWMVPAAIALVMAVHLVTVSSHRFAVPILPLAFIVAAGPLAAILAVICRRPALRLVTMVVIAVTVVLQPFSWPITYHLHAADMDGIAAADVPEEAAGTVVRVAGVARGPRPVILLVDEQLPSGRFDVRLTLRAPEATPDDRRIAFRLSMTMLDGRDACTHDVPVSKLSATFETLTLPCALDRTGPVTLILQTAAIVELRFADVVLAW